MIRSVNDGSDEALHRPGAPNPTASASATAARRLAVHNNSYCSTGDSVLAAQLALNLVIFTFTAIIGRSYYCERSRTTNEDAARALSRWLWTTRRSCVDVMHGHSSPPCAHLPAGGSDNTAPSLLRHSGRRPFLLLPIFGPAWLLLVPLVGHIKPFMKQGQPDAARPPTQAPFTSLEPHGRHAYDLLPLCHARQLGVCSASLHRRQWCPLPSLHNL